MAARVKENEKIATLIDRGSALAESLFLVKRGKRICVNPG
jgi:hypothetical protein